MRRHRLVALLGLFVLMTGSDNVVAVQDSPLALAQAFVAAFEMQYVRLVAHETYSQRVVQPANGARRLLLSDVAAAHLDAPSGFVFLRSVVRADNQLVTDSGGRLDALLGANVKTSRDSILALRDEGARFNVGTIHRNLNDPTLALRFLDPDVASRFAFEDKGTQALNGTQMRRLSYREVARPTLIRDGNLNVPASGTIWVAADGVVRQTELEAAFLTAPPPLESGYVNVRTVARIVVQFAREDRLSLWVPLRMHEEYRKESDALGADGTSVRTRIWERIEGDAQYDNYRRFETAVRIVP